MRVVTIVGTRPEIIKLSQTIKLFDEFTEHTLIHTGQNYNYELNQIFFKDLEIREPDYFLEAVGQTPFETIGLIIQRVGELLTELKPDAVLLYGDTNSCLSVISAKKLQIPVFHMEAGNRCFDERVPEENNRKIVDHLSDINFVLSENARQNLLCEGIKPHNIFKTGSHLFEVIKVNEAKVTNSKVLDELCIIQDKFFLFSAHREENVDDVKQLENIICSLNAIASKYKLPVIVSLHPRTQKRLSDSFAGKLDQLVALHKPFCFTDYLKLQRKALVTLSDSGTLTEETSIMGTRSVAIRESHERPEGFDNGILIMSGLRADSILNAVDATLKLDKTRWYRNFVADYEKLGVSEQILKTVLSYVDDVNRRVWSKEK